MVDNVVIMAGGAGKRLWPSSMGRRPKQFMCVDGDVSLFHRALDRAFGLGIKGYVYIITHENHLAPAMQECRKQDADDRRRIVIMAEPLARNTAPALALAGAGMSMDGRLEKSVLVMTADHLISPMEAFRQSVEQAAREAEKKKIVLYGIVPRGPATGYGYIETAGRKFAENSSWEVLSFREKPDAETAQGYVNSGCYFWNSGIFTYKGDVFANELKQCQPELAEIFENPQKMWFSQRIDSEVTIRKTQDILRSRYEDCPSISVDYAVMEKSKKIRMVEADFEWSDVGSWDVIADLGMMGNEKIYNIQSSGNYVHSDCPVALCGVKDLIVVVANGRVMICKKGMSHLVKDAAEEDLRSL